jgi:hypothetical protein
VSLTGFRIESVEGAALGVHDISVSGPVVHTGQVT